MTLNVAFARAVAFGFALAIVAGPVSSAAGETDTRWYDEISLDSFVSLHYSYNTNKPGSVQNGYRVFDVDDNSFVLDVAELVLQRPAAAPGESGFRVDVTAGGTIPRTAAAAGLFRGEDGRGQDFDLQQAFVSYVARVGRGLRLEAGKYVTHLGYEVIEGYDGYNDNASRSFLFGYAIPFTHTGVRLGYPVSDRVTAQLLVMNGWDNARDNNRDKTVGAQVVLTPVPSLQVWLNGITGPERAGNNRDDRNVADLVVVLKPAPRLGLGLNCDYGEEDGATAPGRTAIWSGLAGYVRYDVLHNLSLAARAEQFDDRSGARTGREQKLGEITFTTAVKLSDALLVRGELRHDWSDVDAFEKKSNPADGQTTMSVNMVWAR